ncbi:MAG: zf-HC2 domain-containing protein [Polyangiaceae bacterium]|jgi:hypothetical protein
MIGRCIDQPVSWLRLELYQLGEVDGAERASIASHLASCPACAECLASVESDEASALPPLPAAREVRARGLGARARLGAYGASVLALAAAAMLGVGARWRQGSLADSGGAAGVKGDAVAFSLVRDDDQRIDDATGVFRDGDRFKAVVTCPPSMGETFDLVVYDASGASFPLTRARVACGNGVPLPGAFRLSGSAEETVCLTWGLEREPLRAGAPAQRVLCKHLTASRAPP